MGSDHLHDLPPHSVVGVEARHRVLEDHPDLRPAYRAELGRGHGEQVFPLEEGSAGHSGPDRKAYRRLDGDALARARLADDAQRLTGVHREADAPHGFDDSVGSGERDDKILHFEQQAIHSLGKEAQPIGRRAARRTTTGNFCRTLLGPPARLSPEAQNRINSMCGGRKR